MRTSNVHRLAALYLAVIAGCAIIFTNVALAEETDHEPITQELILLLENNPEIKDLLEKSIEKAAKLNNDLDTNPAQNLGEFYEFIDRASEGLPQDILLSHDDPYLPTVSERMVQGLCYCLFAVDQPLEELIDKGLCDNSLQFYEPFATWYRHFAVTWGQYLCTEDSWSDEIYEEIKKDPTFHLDDDTYESPDNWNTFNRFFCRYLSDPEVVRPIESPDDPTIVVSPADSQPQLGPDNEVWPIDSESKIVVKNEDEEDNALEVKGLFRYYSVHDLLLPDSEYRDAFAGGVLTHNFLNVNDYHRYHFAVGGTIKEKGILTRNAALDGIEWDKEKKEYTHKDMLGFQFSQTLGYVIMDTGKYGLVALIPMGMSQVSSVNFEDTVKVGAEIKKGDMLGYFLFGGSDFVLLFQEEAGFKLTAPMENETEYKHILVGEEYGRMGSAK